MTAGNTIDPSAVPSEIARLVAFAGQEGEADHYPGKRETTRYAEGLRLDVTTNPQGRADSWAVSMQDISTGGVSFWSKRKIDDRTDVWVREFTSDNNALWIPARVSHCTVGIRGHLIGAAFVAMTTQRTNTPPAPVRVEPAEPVNHSVPSAGRAPQGVDRPPGVGIHPRGPRR